MEKCNCRGTPEDDAKDLESTMENKQEAKGTKLKEKLENLVGFSPTLGLPDDVNRKRGELCTGPSAANRVPCAVNGVFSSLSHHWNASVDSPDSIRFVGIHTKRKGSHRTLNASITAALRI